jgi:uncharacterized protein
MMPEKTLTAQEKTLLLKIARQSMEAAVNQLPLPPIDKQDLSHTLVSRGASFVTLTVRGNLRGCIGALEAYQPLVDDVQEHAVAAALEDYRFPPVQSSELAKIHIEISHLTAPVPLAYEDAQDLLAKLNPGSDGVILRDGRNRATFLPQVWEKVPDPEDFLSQLCMKMGEPPNTWRRKHLDVSIYHVEEFHEAQPGS